MNRNEPFVIERVYNARIEKVWEAITNREQMKQWYFDLEDFRPEVGFHFSFLGIGAEGASYNHLCTVTAVVPGEKIAYSWRYDGHEGNSVVTFELFAEGSSTRLRLTHDGLETFPSGNADFARSSFEGGWTELIGTSLQKFVE